MSDSASFRSGKIGQAGQFAPNVLDVDPALSANDDTRLATQKAAKAYADTKVPQNLGTLQTMLSSSGSDLVLVYDSSAGANRVISRSELLGNPTYEINSTELNALHQEMVVLGTGPTHIHVQPHETTWEQNVWINTASTNVGRSSTNGCGSQNNALLIGGQTAGHTGSATTLTEEFLGDMWRSGAHSLIIRAAHAATGTRNAGVIHGGQGHGNLDSAERYNGDSFVHAGNPGVTYSHAAMGIMNAALFAGGGGVSNPPVRRYNGAAFSTGPQLQIVRSTLKGAGHANASLVANGYAGSGNITNTEKFSGDAWVLSENTNYSRTGNAIFGVQNACTVAVGNLNTEEYNGYVWVIRPAPNYVFYNGLGTGASGAGLQASGYGGSGPISSSQKWFGRIPMEVRVTAQNAENEYYFAMNDALSFAVTDAADIQIEWTPQFNANHNAEDQADWDRLHRFDLGDGAWVQETSMNTERQGAVGVGRSKGTLAAGGSTRSDLGGISTAVELYNGSSWSAATGLNTGTRDSGGVGVSYAALVFGGRAENGSFQTRSENFDGSTWSVGAALTQAESQVGDAGVAKAALSFGGNDYDNRTERYNGTAWSVQVGGDLNTGKAMSRGLGPQNACLAISGVPPGAALSGGGTVPIADTEKFNGFSWSNATPVNHVRKMFSAAGTQNVGLVANGSEGSSSEVVRVSEKYNGFVWINASQTNSALYDTRGAGTQMSALTMGGLTSGGSTQNTVEHYQTQLSLSGAIGAVTYS